MKSTASLNYQDQMTYRSSLIHKMSAESICARNQNLPIDLYLVGNRFVDFACNEMVLTVNQFFNWAKSMSLVARENNYVLHAGQGITDQDNQKIVEFIRRNKLYNQFICSDSLFPSGRAARYMTHKHQDKNTIISEPTKLSEICYESYLMIDENCADLSDHLTGQHIQGAVLMEAARQMTLAVTEKYFIADEYRNQVSFVSNAVQTKFYAYAFPLEIKIRYEIKKQRGLKKQNSQFMVLVTFLQNEEPVSEVTYDFSVLNKSAHYFGKRWMNTAKPVTNQSTLRCKWCV